MEEQIPPSQQPFSYPVEGSMTLEGQITPEMVAQMKARARELAVKQVVQQNLAQQAAIPQQQPQIIYLRRNLTVAEILLVILLSCGIVTGVQWTWNMVTNILPRVEIKVR